MNLWAKKISDLTALTMTKWMMFDCDCLHHRQVSSSVFVDKDDELRDPTMDDDKKLKEKTTEKSNYSSRFQTNRSDLSVLLVDFFVDVKSMLERNHSVDSNN